MMNTPDVEKMSHEELMVYALHLQMAVRQLQKRVSALEESNSEMGWRLNPDRMGGQFTDEERNRSGWI
jgi:hypothetical protein